MGKRRGESGPQKDQYGEFGGSQDREVFVPFGSKSQKGGGTAGGSKKGSTDLNFQRHIPKFLQQYSHLLGQAAQDEDEPVVVGDEPGAKEEEEEDQEESLEAHALRRAMADNPELAKEFEGQLESRLRQAEAAEEKERGNAAFGKKKFDEAIKSFSRCIELDPSNEVYFSNRSAAYASLERWQEAADDAKRCVGLKAGWAKGWARLAAACMGLKLYPDAKEAYDRALKIEPTDQALQKGSERAEFLEYQQVRENKVTFKKMRRDDPSKAPKQEAPTPAPAEATATATAAPAADGRTGAAPAAGAGKAALKPGAAGGAGTKSTALLSFRPEEDDEEQ